MTASDNTVLTPSADPTATNRDVLLRMIDRFNAGDLEGYLGGYDADCVLHGFPPDLPAGLDGVRAFYTTALAAFPDAHVTLHDVLAESDRVAVRLTIRGTHAAPFLGIPPTARTVSWGAMTVMRFRDGLCAERWHLSDLLSLLQQLGALPAPA